MPVRPQFALAGEFNLPKRGGDGVAAERVAHGDGTGDGLGQFDGGADEVVAVAASVAFGPPLPVEVLQFRAEAQGFARQSLRLGLFLGKQDEESGAAEAAMVVEMVDLGCGVVELQAQGHGDGAVGDGDFVDIGPAESGDEDADAGCWTLDAGGGFFAGII